MLYQKRVVIYEEVDLDPKKLMGISEAAKVLGMSIPGLRSLIDRGGLTEIIDPDALEQRWRRFVLRAEVEEAAARRQRAAAKRAAVAGEVR